MIAGVAGDACIVDEDIETAPDAGGVGQGLAAFFGGDIRLNQPRLRPGSLAIGNRLFGIGDGFRAVDDDIGAALFCQPQRDGAPSPVADPVTIALRPARSFMSAMPGLPACSVVSALVAADFGCVNES